MKRTLKRIFPLLLVIVVICSIAWYLFVYDRDFTRDMLLSSARYFDERGNHDFAAWLYKQAYLQSDNNEHVAIELAEQFKGIGNYTQAETTLAGAIADGGSAELYIALCKTYVEQNKLLDAVTMLDSISNPQVKAELDALRPKIPEVNYQPGSYTQYITLSFTSEGGTLYTTTDGLYPSLKNAPSSGEITLVSGENTIFALVVGDNGLVSPLAIYGYVVVDVIEEVTLQDPMIDALVRQQLGMGSDTTLYSNDLWKITELAIPDGLGGLLKMLKVPVIMVTTQGAFSRDPLYNGLRLRKVKVSADVRCLFTAEQVAELSAEELSAGLKQAFTFDAFAWQQENGIEIKEPFRAIGLERILYKCSECGVEGQMIGEGTEIYCKACGKRHVLTTLGRLEATEGETRFAHVPDWYAWERQCVREEIERGEYSLDTKTKIAMLVDHKALYTVGEGRLTHGTDGFVLDGCDGQLHYEQKPLSSHSLNSDYFWYEIGDMISIGNRDALFYCFPETEGIVTKTRLAAEEIYKIKVAEKRVRVTSRSEK